ncbi:hypothetical protein, partial [Pseudomonas aeruginosa]|uniref:hypothetical protein n=1 Tax=Pseudomonas aeruginosa TaxID=287 RepID=UPI00215CD5CA
MTNLQIAALAQPSMVTQLLTADGGEWEVSKHLQEIMALAADGTLYRRATRTTYTFCRSSTVSIAVASDTSSTLPT